MTGFGSFETEISGLGKISVELRSTNHKFLETVLHLPDGYLSLEERAKKAIEAKIKRGRITCAINFGSRKDGNVFINDVLLSNYIAKINRIKRQFNIEEGLSLDTLIRLPGVLTLEEKKVKPESIWPKLRIAVSSAVNNLVKTRTKEGKALQGYLLGQVEQVKKSLENIKLRLKTSLAQRLKSFESDEERASFLKDTDTTEEIDRLVFHIHNFKVKINQGGTIGKELDFIAQEMQREANTLAAKTFDVTVSSLVLKIKSLIEKIREQVQNIE
jgi:uncharacterized protein (TIGR00255 family)